MHPSPVSCSQRAVARIGPIECHLCLTTRDDDDGVMMMMMMMRASGHHADLYIDLYIAVGRFRFRFRFLTCIICFDL